MRLEFNLGVACWKFGLIWKGKMNNFLLSIIELLEASTWINASCTEFWGAWNFELFKCVGIGVVNADQSFW